MNKLDIDRIIQMAWEDRTPFEAIKYQFNITEKEVIQFDEKRDDRKELEKSGEQEFKVEKPNIFILEMKE